MTVDFPQDSSRNKAKWFMEEGALPSYSIAEVTAGFKAHPDLLEQRFNC
jgi:cytochrome c oxidase subunit 3